MCQIGPKITQIPHKQAIGSSPFVSLPIDPKVRKKKRKIARKTSYMTPPAAACRGAAARRLKIERRCGTTFNTSCMRSVNSQIWHMTQRQVLRKTIHEISQQLGKYHVHVGKVIYKEMTMAIQYQMTYMSPCSLFGPVTQLINRDTYDLVMSLIYICFVYSSLVLDSINRRISVCPLSSESRALTQSIGLSITRIKEHGDRCSMTGVLCSMTGVLCP